MNQIKHEELFGNVKNFLKSKGIELQEGSYSQRVRQGCEILADSINVSQSTLKKAKSAVDKGLDQIRQTIHEQTAPKSPAAEGAPHQRQSGSATRAADKSPTARQKSSKPGRRAPKG
jgi:hypothetical protein